MFTPNKSATRLIKFPAHIIDTRTFHLLPAFTIQSTRAPITKRLFATLSLLQSASISCRETLELFTIASDFPLN